MTQIIHFKMLLLSSSLRTSRLITPQRLDVAENLPTMVCYYPSEIHLLNSFANSTSHDVFRALVPQPHDRIPIFKHHIPYLLFPFVPLIYMGYLGRRPNTFTLRLLLLPLVVTVAVGTYFRFMWTDPRHNVYNWGQGKSLVLNITSFVLVEFL